MINNTNNKVRESGFAQVRNKKQEKLEIRVMNAWGTLDSGKVQQRSGTGQSCQTTQNTVY